MQTPCQKLLYRPILAQDIIYNTVTSWCCILFLSAKNDDRPIWLPKMAQTNPCHPASFQINFSCLWQYMSQSKLQMFYPANLWSIWNFKHFTEAGIVFPPFSTSQSKLPSLLRNLRRIRVNLHQNREILRRTNQTYIRPLVLSARRCKLASRQEKFPQGR